MFGKKNEEGENFWVSYTDMMTGFVTILLIVAATSVYINTEIGEKLTEEEKKGLIENKLKVVPSEAYVEIAKEKFFDSFFSEVSSNINSKGLGNHGWGRGYVFDKDQQLIRITDLGEPLFEQGEKVPNPKFVKHLRESLLPEIFKWINKMNRDKDLKKSNLKLKEIRIEGHTNSDGTTLDNLNLSNERAYEVLKVIYDWAKESPKMSLVKLYFISVGFGQTRPIYQGEIEDKKRSRRIEIRFIMEEHNSEKK